MSRLFPIFFLLIVLYAQDADSDNEPIPNFFQGVPVWVLALCFAVLVFVCVGALCTCRYDTMMQIEAQMVSGEQ